MTTYALTYITGPSSRRKRITVHTNAKRMQAIELGACLCDTFDEVELRAGNNYPVESERGALIWTKDGLTPFGKKPLPFLEENE